MEDKRGEHPFGDAGQLILLGVFLVVWVGDSFFLHLSTFLSRYLPLYIRLFILAVTLIAAALLFGSGHVVVSSVPRPNRIISTGAFRYVRHPLYLASILTYFGLTISTASLLSLAGLVGIFAFYNYIASYEEKLLLAKFGEDYHEYKKRTGKWLPRFDRRQMLMVFAFLFGVYSSLSAESRGVEHGQRYDRLVIRNVIVIDGKGTPPRGPQDIVIEGNMIAAVTAPNMPDAYKNEKHILDGTGMFLLPGLINSHVHLQDERAGIVQPFEYEYKIWLGCGITTVRDVGSDYSKTIAERRKSQDGTIVAPRIFLYMTADGRTPQEGRTAVQKIKEQGGDGVKIFGLDRDIMAAIVDEAKKLGLRVASHAGVEETDAWDIAAFGVASIEHWYGVPDAALIGSQNFPPTYNFSNENDRFRWAGRLWREADPLKLDRLLTTLVEKGVAWVPTFSTYEACRDMTRARNLPWFRDYLHPALEEYFKPNPARHGAFSWNWTTEDEIFWKENFRIWMKAVRDFSAKGGLVGAAEDAGFIYTLYGFTFLSELELLQEAGFQPIDVIQCATGNNAKIMGIENKLGRVRQGFLADLILLDENPLQNLKFLYPTGVLDIRDGKLIQRGGVKWTIKDGIVYHAPTLLRDVVDIVSRARAERGEKN